MAAGHLPAGSPGAARRAPTAAGQRVEYGRAGDRRRQRPAEGERRRAATWPSSRTPRIWWRTTRMASATCSCEIAWRRDDTREHHVDRRRRRPRRSFGAGDLGQWRTGGPFASSEVLVSGDGNGASGYLRPPGHGRARRGVTAWTVPGARAPTAAAAARPSVPTAGWWRLRRMRTNLSALDTNFNDDVYVRDRTTATGPPGQRPERPDGVPGVRRHAQCQRPDDRVLDRAARRRPHGRATGRRSARVTAAARDPPS